uniref:Uncharacterized protein n=1 Tax=Nothobranchius furzeri TaxID=105023 RepID=A0A8C6PIB5_NOTFU
MESTSPVDGDVRLLLQQLRTHRTAFLPDINWGTGHTSLHLFAVLRHVVWANGPQELNVVVAVVLCHLLGADFHFPVQPYNVKTDFK